LTTVASGAPSVLRTLTTPTDRSMVPSGLVVGVRDGASVGVGAADDQIRPSADECPDAVHDEFIEEQNVAGDQRQPPLPVVQHERGCAQVVVDARVSLGPVAVADEIDTLWWRDDLAGHSCSQLSIVH